MNVQGLVPQTVQSKVPFIRDTIVPEKQLFIGLSETWLRSHKQAELDIDGYTIFRCDSSRNKKSNRGRFTGGVAIYLRDDIAITSEILLSYSTNSIQLLSLYSKSENLVIATLYRQPNDKAHGNPSTPGDLKIALARLNTAISEITPTPDIILGGDFNVPHVNWPEGIPSNRATLEEKQMINHLNELCNELFLTQIVTSPTHRDGNTLDLVFVNNLALVHDSIVLPVLQSTSHHSIVQVSTTYKADPQNENESCPKPSYFNSLNFFHENVDWTNISCALKDIDWEAVFKDKSIDDNLNTIYSECFRIVSKSVPQKPQNGFKTNKVLRYRKSLTNRRRRINKRLTRLTSPAKICKLRQELLDIEKKLQKSYRESSEYMENKAVKSIKVNPKYFYAYTKKSSKCKSKIGPLLDPNSKLTSNSKEMAEILSKQYASVFSIPKDGSVVEPTSPGHGNKLNDIVFDQDDMQSAIDELKTTAAAGDDGFPAVLLKNCKEELSRPLALFWRKCLDHGYIPPSLKRSLISPIHKGDSRAIPANYRPIALTSHLIKVFEKILRTHIVHFMNKHNLFNKHQHGFRAGRSCLSQLLEHFDQILDILEEGANVDVVYLDFAKAFDKLDFKIVMKKISELGIEGNVYNWIQSFLKDRVQQVTIKRIKSDPMPVISGVPQGSVIGPLLFLILISDIDEEIVEAFVKSFADDTRAAKSILSRDDVVTLQSELNKIYSWADNNNMKLNDSKFEVIRYGQDQDIKAETKYKSPSGDTIEIKETVKDLGVLLSDNCSFRKHIETTIAKARNMISWIFRTFKTRKPEPMLILFKMLVLPILEYCSVLWSPQDVGSIQKLDEIQRSFIRKISNDADSDYWKRLKQFKLYSLERRRERYRIMYVWKVLEGLVPNVNNKIASKTHARHGRKCLIPIVPRGNLSKIKLASFPIQGANLFNALPKHVRNVTNTKLDCFKRALDAYLKSVPDEPQLAGYTLYRRASSNSIIHMSPYSENLHAASSIPEAANAGSDSSR